MPITTPPSKSASTFCVDAAVAARAVVARRLCSPRRELGAGPCRAPGERTSRAPRHHRDITLRCPSPRRRPRARRPAAPTPPLPPAPSWRVGSAHLVASSAPARAARRVSAPLALPRHHRDITLRCPSPRRRPRARRPAAPTPPLPPAPSWRVDSDHLVASSAPARAARRVSAPLALLATTVTSPCDAHHRAAVQERVDLLRRRRRCRPRRRGASALFTLSRARRRPVPRAERAHLSRSLVTTVTSPCDAHHHAAVQERVDLLRRRRRCRPRRRGASALLKLVASSAPARAARRVSAPLALPRHHRYITLRCPSSRRRPRARRPAAPTPPLPPAPSWRVGSAHLVASSAPARAARRVSAPLALPRHHRDITLRCPTPRHSPSARRPSAPTSPLPPAPSWRVGSARPVASSAPALAARRLSAPLALPRHHRDLTLRAQRCPSPCRRPSARRPAAPTSPLPPAPSWRVGAARPVASSAPARAARRVSAPLARPRHHCDITLRTLRCPSLRRRPSARRPSAPTPSLPPAPSWHVDVARFVAGSAPARAARRLSAPLARPRHCRDITLRTRAPLDAHPCATVQARVDLPRRRLVVARAVVARLPFSPRLAPRVRASALPARLCHHRELTSVSRPLRCPSPRHTPRPCRLSASTSSSPPAPS